MLRVLHVVRQFHPAVGGLEGFVLALAKQQRKQGILAEVVTLDRLTKSRAVKLPASDTVEGVPVRRISYFGSPKYPLAFGVLRHLHDFDLAHVHGVDFFCDYLALTRPMHRKPLVLSTHGGYFHTSFALGLKKLFFETVTRLSLTQYYVCAISTNDMELFGKIKSERLTLIENGVDTEKFADAASSTFRPGFIFIGRFSVNKRIDALIDAFRAIAEDIPDAHLHIVGNDWDNLLPALREQIARSPNSDSISIHTGLSDDDIRRIMGQCSFFVSASEYEGFGLTLVEAMSAGLVPIVNDINSFRTIISNSAVGLLTNFSDPGRAGAEALEFVNETKQTAETSRAAAIAASHRYNWEATERRFKQVYDEVMAEAAVTERKGIGRPLP